MPQINTDVWGEGVSLYTNYINTRTGASDISNADYTAFPPFAFLNESITPPSPNNNTASLHKLFALNKIELNTPLDESICFVGMYNSDLPQLNIGVIYPDDTVENPTFKTDNTQIQSYFLYTNLENFTYYAPGNINVADGYIVKPSYNSGNLSKYLDWCDDGYSGLYNNDVPAIREMNANLKIDPLLKWGVKTFFLVINVVYISSWDSTSQPISSHTTLNDYLNGVGHDDTWKREHPVMCAYGQPYIRHNVNGEYTTATYSQSDLLPAFTLPLTGIDDGEEHSIINYAVTTNQAALQNSAAINGCFPIYGQIVPTHYNEPRGSTTFSAPAYLGYNRGTFKKAPTNNVFWFELDLTNSDNVEYLMRGCAAYGLFFSDDMYDLAQSGRDETRWIDVNMCCGTIDEDGRTNGDYTRGAMNVLQRQFNWSDSTESPFDPSAPPIPENEYNTQTVFNTVSGISTMTQRYAMTAGAVKNLGAALWSISADLIDDGGGGQDYSELNEKILDTFLTNNPIDCIVSLRKYPFEISKDDSTMIKLGKYETTVGAYTMSETLEIFEFRMKNKILPIFNDSFMDYEPYTHFELYVPFCGTVSVEPADILGRQLSVKLAVDYSTGTCTAYILTDDLVIKTISGQIAIDIPVSGIQAVTAASQINNAIAQASTAHKQERSATLGNVSVGGAVQFMLNPVKTIESAGIAENTSQRADYELQHQNIQPHLIGSASSAASWLIDFSCRLLIYYPTGEILYNNNNPPSFDPLKLLEYGHTVGFACCMTGALSSFTGLTVAVRADLNNITTNGLTARPATLQELQMLEAALNEGVIL